MITIEGGRPGLKLTAYRLSLPESTRDAVGAAAFTMKRTITAGAPARLRGAGKKGARLGVQYALTKGITDPSARIRATGPWQLIESDTKPHLILSKKLGTRRTRANIGSGLFVRAEGRRLRPSGRGQAKKGAVLTPQGLRAYARHPGTRGQHPWQKGVERGEPKAIAAYANKIQADFRRQFI